MRSDFTSDMRAKPGRRSPIVRAFGATLVVIVGSFIGLRVVIALRPTPPPPFELPKRHMATTILARNP